MLHLLAWTGDQLNGQDCCCVSARPASGWFPMLLQGICGARRSAGNLHIAACVYRTGQQSALPHQVCGARGARVLGVLACAAWPVRLGEI